MTQYTASSSRNAQLSQLDLVFILIFSCVRELNQIKVLLLNPLVKQFLLHVTIGDLSVAQQYFPLWFSAKPTVRDEKEALWRIKLTQIKAVGAQEWGCFQMVLLNLIKAGGVGRWEWFKWQDKDRHIGVCWSRCHSSDDPPPLKPPLCFNLIQLYNHTLYSIHFNPLYLKLYPDLQPATPLKALQSSLWALCHILHQVGILQIFNCKPFEILIQCILSNHLQLQQTELPWYCWNLLLCEA